MYRHTMATDFHFHTRYLPNSLGFLFFTLLRPSLHLFSRRRASSGRTAPSSLTSTARRVDVFSSTPARTPCHLARWASGDDNDNNVYSEMMIMIVLPHLKLALSYILGKDSNNQNGRWFFHGGGEGLKFHIPILKNNFLENI